MFYLKQLDIKSTRGGLGVEQWSANRLHSAPVDRIPLGETITAMSILTKLLNHGRVMWSSGQHRRLPLQGSRVRIPSSPLLFRTYLEQTQVKKCEVRNRRSISRDERGTKVERRQEASKVEWLRERRSQVRFEDD